MGEIIDRSSPIPKVSWSVFLGVVALIVAATTWKNLSESTHLRLRNDIDDTVARQNKYIQRRDEQHAAQQVEIDRLRAELRDHEERYHRMCHEIAVRLEEAICD